MSRRRASEYEQPYDDEVCYQCRRRLSPDSHNDSYCSKVCAEGLPLWERTRVESAIEIEGLPTQFLHGTNAGDEIRADGVCVEKAGSILCYETYCWEDDFHDEMIQWSHYAWDWWKAIPAKGRRRIENDAKMKGGIKSRYDLGQAISLFWVTIDPSIASGSGETVLRLRRDMIPMYGFFQDTEIARRGSWALVLPVECPQIPPEALL